MEFVNVWDSLVEVYVNLGNIGDVICFYCKIFVMDDDNLGVKVVLELFGVKD